MALQILDTGVMWEVPAFSGGPVVRFKENVTSENPMPFIALPWIAGLKTEPAQKYHPNSGLIFDTER
jgi:hypothetical protein